MPDVLVQVRLRQKIYAPHVNNDNNLFILSANNIEGLTTEFQVFTVWYGIE